MHTPFTITQELWHASFSIRCSKLIEIYNYILVEFCSMYRPSAQSFHFDLYVYILRIRITYFVKLLGLYQYQCIDLI